MVVPAVDLAGARARRSLDAPEASALAVSPETSADERADSGAGEPCAGCPGAVGESSSEDAVGELADETLD
jgi:hypothetical protein